MLTRYKIIIILLLIGLSVASVAAQDSEVLVFNENRLGEITSPGAVVSFVINAAPGETVTLQVLGFNEGLVPAFTVLDNANNLVRTVENPTGTTVVEGTVSLPQGGAYIVQVRGANNTLGRFVITMLPAGAGLQTQASPLFVGQPVLNVVSLAAPTQSFSFSALLGNAQTLQVRSIAQTGGPAVTLTDALTGESLASLSSRLAGSDLQIPPGTGSFVVTVQHSGSGFDEGFSISLLTGTLMENAVAPVAAPPPVVAAPTVPPPPPPPADVDLVLRWAADNFTLTNVSGTTPNLTSLRFVGAGRDVDANEITQSGASAGLTSFAPDACFAFRPLGFDQPPPAPPECRSMRAWWFSDNVVFWTGASFDVIYNGQATGTCDTASGRCEVDLPGL